MDGTKKDYWENDDNLNASHSFGSPAVSVPLRWLAQSFTPQQESAYQVTSVWLAIGRPTNDDHGDLVVGIREAGINDAPIFSDLVVGSIATTDIPVTGRYNWTWVEVPFDPVTTLESGRTYTIVSRLPYSALPYSDATAIRWWGSYDLAGQYPYGYMSASSDGGLTWENWTESPLNLWDRGFQVWGVDIGLWIYPLPPFPPGRPDDYSPDDFWIPGDWDGDTYTPPEWAGPTPGRYFATGGGRWGQQLVAVGHGKVYYEELI